ncbi:hypothetical protein ACFL6S_29575 [Candidatus Poribacteria bacterium]
MRLSNKYLLLFVALCLAGCARVVKFEDTGMEATIREAIGKPEGAINEDDLRGITELKSEATHRAADKGPGYMGHTPALHPGILRFARGSQPVLWYLDIGTRMFGPRELYFDDLVPEFCLYGNGDLIYRDKRSFAAGKWKSVKLNEAEMGAMLDEALRSKITSYDPASMAFTKSFAVSDRPTTVIGIRLRHLGSDVKYFQEVSIYGLEVLVNKFPEVEIFKKLVLLAEFLREYQHPKARDYRPEAAELSVVKMDPGRMGTKLRKDIETHWDSIPRWDISEVELDKTEKRGWHNVLELEGQEIDNVLKLLDLEDQPKTYRYRERLYKIQFRPIFPHFPVNRTYLPFPESVLGVNNSEVPRLE